MTETKTLLQCVVEPAKSEWTSLLQRPADQSENLIDSVSQVLAEVQQKGDFAVQKYTRHFDRINLDQWRISSQEIEDACRFVAPELQDAIRQAAANIRKFHSSQITNTEVIETMPGVRCWRKQVPIQTVGLYVPGGSAPLFSTVLMLAIPAQLAGCQRVVLCTPPGRDGKVNPAILFAAQLTGVTEVYRIGGIQAIGAMAYGTESVPAVDKIFGPGNQFVTVAKQVVAQSGVAIDMPAGPSEVLVLADESANPDFVAADLLSQAEHGPDSQVILVASNTSLVEAVEQSIGRFLNDLPRKAIAEKALENSRAIVIANKTVAMELVNGYAPEHLILATDDAAELAEKVVNAGSVFLGNYTPESAGDYASGTNHTLPTNGFAKAYSGVSVDSFTKKITFQTITPDGLKQVGSVVQIMAAAEQLEAHKLAVACRLEALQNQGR